MVEDPLTRPPPTAAPASRLIVIGASAGGLAPLQTVVAGLPADLDAAVLVVVHLWAEGTSVLPEILARVGTLAVAPAVDGLVLRSGLLVAAPPDQHLLVADGHVVLAHGARVHGHRPGVDALFRSAAAAFGERCCAVVLSGARDDGTAGVGEVKRRGGTVLVQRPRDALFAGMPANAVAGGGVDAVLPAEEIGPALVRWTDGASVQALNDPARLSSPMAPGAPLPDEDTMPR